MVDNRPAHWDPDKFETQAQLFKDLDAQAKTSVAISLKRIADVLEKWDVSGVPHVQLEDRPIIDS